MAKNEQKLLELRNICFAEGDDFVQMSYLCGVDSTEDIGRRLLEKFGSLHEMGMASMGKFLNLGIYPASICYERGCETLRNMENDLEEDFECVHGNIYRTDDNSIAGRISKRAA